MPDTDRRIMRIPIPVPLIREMDAVILQGVGGYSTRAEFIVDAIQERILELYSDGTEEAGPPPFDPVAHGNVTPVVRPSIPVAADPTLVPTPATPAMTALVVPEAGFVVAEDADLSRAKGHPLFGLHNRDYPSLWVLTKLAAMTIDRPLPIEEFFAEVLEEAWRFGELLVSIEKHTGFKCTALFPTNPEKRKPAEMGFRSFAVGNYRNDGDAYSTSGPLFEWRLIGLVAGEHDKPLVGVTSAGWALLAGVSGISVEQPHPAAAAEVFLGHLAEHAPADWRGFTEVVRAIGSDGATRDEVLHHMARAWTDWSENEVSTNSAGYIARAREWGLVDLKQIKSRYHLTSLGREHANGAA